MKLLVQVAALAACLSSTLGQKLLQKKLDCCENTAAWCVSKTVNQNMIDECKDGVRRDRPITYYMNPNKKRNCKPLKVCKKDTRSRPTTWDFDGAKIEVGFRISCQSDIYESGDTYQAAMVTDVGDCAQTNDHCKRMLNGYLIIFNTNESKNPDQLASRYFRVKSMQKLRNSPYNMKVSTFNWKGNDRTFRKGNTNTGITNFKSNDGQPVQFNAFELAAFYKLLDAWRNQRTYYSNQERRNKIYGKTVKLNEVEQAAKNDQNYLKKTDLFLNAQDANQFIGSSSNDVDPEGNGRYEQNNNNYENSY